tara:strand:- start:49 stop:1026 length:978 start_codon:yes stop_codon:yes gene_type:complete
MRDFFDILKQHDLYNEANHNKSNSEYRLNGNLFEFVSVDQSSRLKGRKRNLAFLNECNEITFDSFTQIIFRTVGVEGDPSIIMDYNPSDEYSWIYTKVKPRDDAQFTITTYKDNKFLEQSLVDEIERLRDTDPDYWRVYGLGQVGRNRATVFKVSECEEIPPDAKLVAKGLDWGFVNDPSVLIDTYVLDNNLYIDELFYDYAMTNRDIHNKLLELGLTRQDEIFADSSEPKSIDELHRFGWNCKPATKGKDSVLMGIDLMKRYNIYVTSRSTNTIQEFRNYKWVEDKNGNLLNKPVDRHNHSIDSIRYSIFTKLSRPNVARYAIR